MDENLLKHNSYNTLIELITESGINASGKDEIYGCIFGRDSAITILKILNVVAKMTQESPSIDKDFLLEACRRSLLTLVSLQGTEFNIESGEEPGKFIHEYRTERFEHLTGSEEPWYLYPDGKLRNYDSIDSTPLALIAIHKYHKITGDGNFLLRCLPAVENGLRWILNLADKDSDNLVEYEFHKDRKFGGLKVQSWTDSLDSIIRPDGSLPKYPIAPVEVQGYIWLTLRLWSDFYKNFKDENGINKEFSKLLYNKSKELKKAFNKSFIFKENGLYFPSQALDGDKNQLRTITGNALILLYSSYKSENKLESILDDRYINDLVKRSFMHDMFEEGAGIRTMSVLSATYNPNQDSYHNGSFWPKLNGLCFEGLVRWGFMDEAAKLKTASLMPINYFKMPVELYIKREDEYLEYKNAFGQVGCRKQAWSAASVLDFLT